MEITEVRIKLVQPGRDKLRAFCSITIDDDFVIRDLKIIEGSRGAFVAMPSRKLTARCTGCGSKNHFRAKYCNDCGAEQPEERRDASTAQGVKLHADVAHPINSPCRDMVQRSILERYEVEVERSQKPGYQPLALDDFDELDDGFVEYGAPREASGGPVRRSVGQEMARLAHRGPEEGDDGEGSDGFERGGLAPRRARPESWPRGSEATASGSRGRAPWSGGEASSDSDGGREAPPSQRLSSREKAVKEEPEDKFGAGLFP